MSADPAPPLDEVVVAVIGDGDRVWVQRRQEDGPLDGCWEFPGGKLRPGEDPITALQREVREETGADIEVGALLEERVHAYRDRRVRLRFHAASFSGDALPSGGEWIGWRELGAGPIPEANRALIARAGAPAP